MTIGPNPEFGWSISRAKVFEFCPRKYYFKYYGMWRGWEKTASDKARLCYLLSRRVSLASWSGQEVHRAIATYLRSALPMDQVIEQTHERMRTQFRCSMSRVWQEPGQAKRFGLLEHFYHTRLDDDEVRQRWEHVLSCLESIGSSDYLQDVKDARNSGRLVFIENPQDPDFENMAIVRPEVGNFRIFAQPDLVLEYGDGTTCIIDWKTGHPPSVGQDYITEQLGLYAIWAAEKLGLDLDSKNTELYEIYLPSLQSRGDALVTANIHQALDFAKSSVQKLRGVLRDAETNLAYEEDFVPAPSKAKCAVCEFRAVCGHRARV